MRCGTGRTLVLLAGGSLATAGWGAVFPFLYADVSIARGLGAAVATGTFTAFALGSVLAAPWAGALADRAHPATVASLSRLAIALTTLLLAWARGPIAIWAAAAAFGAALAVSQPSIQLILLARTPADRRRDVFAWQFIATNLGAAAGAAIGGLLVDLSSQAAMRPVYLLAAGAALLSAGIVAVAGRGTAAGGAAVQPLHGRAGFAELLASRPIRWLLAVAVLITLACYAQFDAGLPSYVLTSTSVGAPLLGGAVAVNAVLVAVLTGPVVAYTRRRHATSLLATCAMAWVGCWLLFGLPLVIAGHDADFVVLGFAALSVGETMMAPILSSLAVSLAPAGASGRSLAAVTGAGTVATAIGPILSGALLALGLPALFIGLQVLCCLAAAAAALKLRAFLPGRTDAERALVAAGN
ncbi:MAG: MFS transporter [Jatrophihabitans sp.]